MKVLRIDAAGVLREVNVSGDFGSINFAQELRTVTLAEALVGELELVGVPISNSIVLHVSGVVQIQNLDYQLVSMGGVSKIVFINDLALGGSSQITEGDKVLIVYSIGPIVPTVEFRKEQFTLTAGDVSNQYVDLSDQVIDLSEKFICSGLLFNAGLHYTLEAVGGVTRVHFEGDLSALGLSPLTPGDIIEIVYAVNV